MPFPQTQRQRLHAYLTWWIQGLFLMEGLVFLVTLLELGLRCPSMQGMKSSALSMLLTEQHRILQSLIVLQFPIAWDLHVTQILVLYALMDLDLLAPALFLIQTTMLLGMRLTILETLILCRW
jgi:hypothetical protein